MATRTSRVKKGVLVGLIWVAIAAAIAGVGEYCLFHGNDSASSAGSSAQLPTTAPATQPPAGQYVRPYRAAADGLTLYGQVAPNARTPASKAPVAAPPAPPVVKRSILPSVVTPSKTTPVPGQPKPPTVWAPIPTTDIGPIVFPRGEAKPEIGSDVPLDKLADLLTVHAGYRVRIVGHVDPGSDSVSGRNLAEDRANAVKQYLLIKGIATRRILAEASEKADSAGRYNSVSCVVEGSR